MHMKLPDASAKLAVVLIGNDKISSTRWTEFDLKEKTKTALKFSLSSSKWISHNDMKIVKTFNNSVFYYDYYAYTISGNENDL